MAFFFSFPFFPVFLIKINTIKNLILNTSSSLHFISSLLLNSFSDVVITSIVFLRFIVTSFYHWNTVESCLIRMRKIQSDHVYLWQLPSPASSSKHILLISNLPPECEFNNKNFLSFGFRVFASYVSDKDWKISLQNFINPEFDHDVDLS